MEIGDWVMRSACQQLQYWQESPYEGLSLAINLSPRQLQNDKLISQLQECLLEFDVNPRLLEIEITETAIIEDVEQSIWVLNQLKKLGVRLAMDDFGTGFSSLSYLKRLPIDELKIDRSFVTDIPNDEDDIVIIQAILSMARAMKMSVIAEGIENRAQLDYLVMQGCHNSQGYYHSCPLPIQRFEEWLTNYQQPLPPMASQQPIRRTH